MEWATVLQTFTTGLAGLATWFIYEHIKDFKSFKKEAGKDIINLQQAGTHFESVVNTASLDISRRVADFQHTHNEFASEISKNLQSVCMELERMTMTTDDIQKRLKRNEKEIRQLKERLEDEAI